MDREYKFKCWDKENKKFVSGYEASRDVWGWLNDDTGSHITLNQNRYIVLQYTGFNDMNGKEIYDGDWVRDNLYGAALPEGERDNVGFVYFSKGGMWLWRRPSNEIDSIGGGETLANIVGYDESEVIGNIYENPNLTDSGAKVSPQS